MNSNYVYYIYLLNEDVLNLKTIFSKTNLELSDIITNLNNKDFNKLINRLKGIKSEPIDDNQRKIEYIANEIKKNIKLKNFLLNLNINNIDFKKINKNSLFKKINKDEEKAKNIINSIKPANKKPLAIENKEELNKTINIVKGQKEEETPEEKKFNKLFNKIKNNKISKEILDLKNKYPNENIEKIKEKMLLNSERDRDIKEIKKLL